MTALSVSPAITFAQAGETNGEPKRVVVLNSTDPYLPAFVVLDSALRDAVRTGTEGPTEFYAETLDMHRFPRSRLEPDLVALLDKKYRDLEVHVVVAIAPIALDFAQRYAAKLWPGAQIVFHSVNTEVLRENGVVPGTIGLPVQLAFGQTIELALKLRPGTRRLAVVAGTSTSDQRHLSSAGPSLDRAAERLDIEYIVGLSLPDTLAAVQALPPDALVLYLSMFRDGAGAPHVPRDVLEQIAAVSPVPIFGVFETYLGHGIAAGAIVSFEKQGRLAGQLVARVLNGEAPSEMGVQSSPAAGCAADWRNLQQWGLDASRLPGDCELRFREVTAWERYQWEILAALSVFLAQAALIAVLVLNRRRLRLAKSALQDENSRRTRAEASAAGLRRRLARFSTQRSLGTMATNISHEINQPLIAIQNYAQAARRRLANDTADKPKLLELFEKIEGQAERAGTITQRVRALVNQGEPDLRLLPLCTVLKDVIRMIAPEAESRGCHVSCEPEADSPMAFIDALQIQLVLVNLLQNAMRSVCATDAYDKHLSVKVEPVARGEVQVSVTDRGAGVAPDRVPDIFEPLYSGTRGGMGMGLAIASAIVEAHGGRLWYEPNPAGGAIFRFTLRTPES